MLQRRCPGAAVGAGKEGEKGHRVTIGALGKQQLCGCVLGVTEDLEEGRIQSTRETMGPG